MGCASTQPEPPRAEGPKTRHEWPGEPPFLFGYKARTRSEMEYTMHVLPVVKLMQMERLEPHQVLLQRGELREWKADMAGRIIFVSHQWLGYKHPDPHGQHFLALKQLLAKLLAGDCSVEESWKGQLGSEKTCTVEGPKWAAALPHMLVWMDFMGIPNLQAYDKVCSSFSADDQPETPASEADTQKLERDYYRAISSIPAYIEQSSLMLVLVPPCQHADTGRMCNFSTWRTRGWCRFEFMAANLSQNGIKVMIHEGSAPFFNFPVDARILPPGQGEFSCCHHNHRINGKEFPCDKATLHPILEDVLKMKIRRLRRQGQREHSLFYAAVSHRFFDGLICKGAELGMSSFAALQRFKLRLGWSADDVTLSESTGWSLLMLAAMADDLHAVRELAADDIDINLGLSRGWPELGCAPRGLTPLMAAMGWARFEVVEALLEAKADAEAEDNEGKGVDALGVACVFGRADNVDGWLKRFPESNLERRDKVVGSTRLHVAAGHPVHSAPVLKVLLAARANIHSGAHAGFNTLTFVTQKDDSDPEAVQLLLDAGIEVNRSSRPITAKWKGLLLGCRIAHRLKAASSLVEVFAQGEGSTALHVAYAKGHFEIIQQLLQAGADERMANALGAKPKDMRRAIPELLVE